LQIQWRHRDDLLSTLRSRLHSVDVVLDIGPGINPQSFVRANSYIWCEPCPEYVEFLQSYVNGCPNIVILKATAQEAVPMMPDRSVDTILLIDVLEHLDRASGQQLLDHCIRLARKQIVVFTPLGFLPQEYDAGCCDSWGMSGAEWQKHRSGWTPEDFDDSWEILACVDFHYKNGAGELLDPPFGAFCAIHHQSPGVVLSRKLALVAPELPPMNTVAASAVAAVTDLFAAHEYYVVSPQSVEVFESIDRPSRVIQGSHYSLRAHSIPETYVDKHFPCLMDELESAVFHNLYLRPIANLFEVTQLVSNKFMETCNYVPVLTKLLETLGPARRAFSQIDIHSEEIKDHISSELLLDSKTVKEAMESVFAASLDLESFRPQVATQWAQAANLGFLSARLLEICDRAFQIRQRLERDPAGALVAFLGGDPWYLPAAFLACCWTGMPIVTCLTSRWNDSWPAIRSRLADTLEECILKRSAAILVTDAETEKELSGKATCPIYRLDIKQERWISFVRSLTSW
jgi:hypothetical protein